MEFDITIHQVGQPFDPAKTRWEEGGCYSYHHDLHIVLLAFHQIRAYERQAVQRGMAWFGLHVEGDVITLLFKCNGPDALGIDWHDCPYSWHLVPPEERTLPVPVEEIPANLGAMFTVYLIEASTGIIEAIRGLNVSHHFTRLLYQAIREQASHPFDKAAYERQIADLRQRFPTPNALAKVAQARCLGGIFEGPG